MVGASARVPACSQGIVGTFDVHGPQDAGARVTDDVTADRSRSGLDLGDRDGRVVFGTMDAAGSALRRRLHVEHHRPSSAGRGGPRIDSTAGRDGRGPNRGLFGSCGYAVTGADDADGRPVPRVLVAVTAQV
jgi:hypothetical protein